MHAAANPLELLTLLANSIVAKHYLPPVEFEARIKPEIILTSQATYDGSKTASGLLLSKLSSLNLYVLCPFCLDFKAPNLP
jgi:hypothetical protein